MNPGGHGKAMILMRCLVLPSLAAFKIDYMPTLQASAILFDFDGVLVDSTAVVAAQYTRWAEERGLPADELVKFAHGVRTIEVVRRWAPQLNAEEETRRIEEREAKDPAVTVMPGALKLLRAIPHRRWGIVTSGGRVLASSRIRVLGLPDPAVLVTADDVTRGKPDPEPYQKGAHLLGLKPEDCIVIEDAPAGIRSAHAAGMRVVSLPSTYAIEDLAEADYLVAGLAQIRVIVNGSDPNAPLLIDLT
jgi:mannitol-1-/sugar-/sorbitol-6-phosphatase